jgi:two-component sensor histidine kinase
MCVDVDGIPIDVHNETGYMTMNTLNRDDPVLNAGERRLSQIHHLLFARNRYLSLLVILMVYTSLMIGFGPKLGVSSNYFVVLPVLVIALCYGFWGGIIAGTLALPANLFLFHLIHHPEFTPESKIFAQLTGMIIGTAFGYLSNYFRILEKEIRRRRGIEDDLRHLLKDREILLQEIHHRVKNNLTIIKSLIQLQKNRSKDPRFINESDKLIQRIYTISLIHEQLFQGGITSSLDMSEYIPALTENIMSGYAEKKIQVVTHVDLGGRDFPLETATALGLIINEVLTNALKYAFESVKKPSLTLTLITDGGNFVMTIQDNGTGFETLETLENPEGLGMKIIAALSTQLRGEYLFSNNGGTCFTLMFPIRDL